MVAGNSPIAATHLVVAHSVRAEEVTRFNALAGAWWDPAGPMAPLHRMNPARIGWILSRLRARRSDLTGLRVLDVGCGAGLAAEALAREGLDVLGIDAASAAIDAARAHAAGLNLPLAYRAATTETLLAEGQKFPVITALEVIEHVAHPAAFIALLAGLLEPGGELFLSTLNRTARSFITAKLGAEYVLRWLPIGTHDWRRFLTPAETAAHLRATGLNVTDLTGLVPNFRHGMWETKADVSVNYLLAASDGT
ncbi:MAG: bifunctional 2-polyprenyl-6-hydroxyphenol methylase/3-demethylubiquinol 3-O-methyltransferase UbiG [Acetobacteraceae bacterium]|nr:bifunctional 2-polyprenyl-6-hydroxyphenol methylase/3-demethylubiquinol 3-O-methyltransferase UbiG [Acetobacteraceae bacterium]